MPGDNDSNSSEPEHIDNETVDSSRQDENSSDSGNCLWLLTHI